LASIIIPLEDDVKARADAFSWVSWSEDQKFCDSIDWYPVDELPLKKEFVQRIKEQSRKPAGRKMSAAEFSKWCDSL
jgi:hypothetical protein